MNDNRFLVTYMFNDTDHFAWFDNEDEMIDVIKLNNWQVIDCIEILDYRELKIK